MLARTLAALLGGYLFASAGAVLASVMFVDRDGLPSDALLGGALWGLVLYALAIIWAFGVRSPAKAWGSLLGATAVLGASAALLVLAQRGAA
ncbi:hypothetical protein ASD15_25615 [Massilia sp. Root351]|nr:hypothetical protein ASD15_25615 [Massilia sp. Root351]